MPQPCTACSTPNRDRARFCKRCGQGLPPAATGALEGMIGLPAVKQRLGDLATTMAAMAQDGTRYGDALHTILMGNTGTGKTQLLHILAEMFHRHGVITNAVARIYDAVDYGDFDKNFADNYKQAKGGILCIDNVHKLIPADPSQSIIALDRLFLEMTKEANRRDPVIVLCGHPQGFREYLNANHKVRGQFPFLFHLPDFTAAELTALTSQALAADRFSLSAPARDKLVKVYEHLLKKSRMPGHEAEARNAWLAQRQAEAIKARYYLNLAGTGARERLLEPDDIVGEFDAQKSLDAILAELDAFIGMDNIKQAVRHLVTDIDIQKQRAQLGVAKEKSIAFHIVLTGNPGTGKTTIARKLGEVLKACGVLELGHVVEVDRSKMVAQYVGQTAPQVNDLCDKALGGLLFIDEAYALKQSDTDSFGQEAIDALLKRMEDDRGKFVVVIAGYPKEINAFLNTNPGLQSRFDERYRFHLDDYLPAELLAIFKQIATVERYAVDPEAEERVARHFAARCAQKDRNFGNGREARTLFEACRSLHSRRIVRTQQQGTLDEAELTRFRAEDVPVQSTGSRDLSDILAEIDKLVGLHTVKQELRSLTSYIQAEKLRAEHGGKETRLNLHFVFRGNPGTGKTTVARLVADVFKSIGLLPKGQLVEVDRSGLVGRYVGDTALKVNAVVDSALGGVLFIDEAYALAGDSFAMEAINTLLKRMEDDKGKFIVIAAGYETEMEDFLNSNSGLLSRFTRFITFEDYQGAEMADIFQRMVSDKGMALSVDAQTWAKDRFESLYAARDRSFANGRAVRNVFERSLQKQAARLAPLLSAGNVSAEALRTLTAADLQD